MQRKRGGLFKEDLIRTPLNLQRDECNIKRDDGGFIDHRLPNSIHCSLYFLQRRFFFLFITIRIIINPSLRTNFVRWHLKLNKPAEGRRSTGLLLQQRFLPLQQELLLMLQQDYLNQLLRLPYNDLFYLEHAEASSTPTELKRKRGKTTAKGLIEMIATNGNKKVEIIFDTEHWVPNTEYSNKKFTTSIGIEVRSRAPVCFRGWNKISADIKRQLREGLTVHFEVEIDHPKIVYFVNDRMRSASTQFKWKLHDHYQKCGTPARGRATLPPSDLWGKRSIEDWHWLCDTLYTDPKYIDKCKKNSASQKEQQSTHRGGAMPFIQHALRTAKEGKPLSFIDNWGAMYQDSNHNWVSDAAKDRFNKLKNKREEIKMATRQSKWPLSILFFYLYSIATFANVPSETFYLLKWWWRKKEQK